MDQLSSVLQSIGSGLGPYAPRLVGALLIVAVAWVAARVVRAAVQRLGDASRLDERIHSPGLAAT